MGSSATEIQRLLQEAKRHLARRELHEAAARATEAIRLDGKEPTAYLVRAEAYRKSNRQDRALADLAVALRLDPNHPAPYVIRAEIAKKRCLFDQAIADATQAIFLDPNNAAAFSIRACCRQSIGDVDGAAEDQEELFRIDPTRPPVISNAEDRQEPSESTDHQGWSKRRDGKKIPDAYKDLFIDGQSVDQPLNLRRPVGEALAEANDYRPEIQARPLPRVRSRGNKRDRSPWPLLTLITAGLAIVLCILLANRRGAEEPTMRPTAPATVEGRLAEPIVEDLGASDKGAVPVQPQEPEKIAANQAEPELRSLILGDTLDGWVTQTPTDHPNWTVRNGIQEYSTFGPSLMTTEKYQDFDLHVEFSLPAGCNSGIFLRGRYELSLHDPTFRDLGPVGNTGAIYATIAPNRQVYRGPDNWNYLDIRLVGTTVTVRMNGVVVIDAQHLSKFSPIAIDQRESEPGVLMLQAYDEVPENVMCGAKFRNMTIRMLPRLGSGSASASSINSPTPAGGKTEGLSPVGKWVELRPGAPGGNRIRTFMAEGTFLFQPNGARQPLVGTWRSEGGRIYFSHPSQDGIEPPTIDKWFSMSSQDERAMSILMMGTRKYIWYRTS